MSSYGEIYSPKLSEFIESKRLGSRIFSYSEIESIAMEKGWVVEDSERDPSDKWVKDGDAWFIMSRHHGLPIHWMINQSFRDPNQVKFHPYFACVNTNAKSRFLEALRLSEIVVDLPEPKVEVPFPEWLKVHLQNQGWYSSNPLMCFASELEEFGLRLVETAKTAGVSQ